MAPDHAQTFSVPFPDYILNSPPLVGMTQTAQNVAEVYGLTRKELDEFSAESHRKCAAAYEAGAYKDEIIPLEVEDPIYDEKGNWLESETGPKVSFDRDECIRPDTTVEKLSGLPGLKGLVSYGGKEIVITAGNSCPTNDGASASPIPCSRAAASASRTLPQTIICFRSGCFCRPPLEVESGLPVYRTEKKLKN